MNEIKRVGIYDKNSIFESFVLDLNFFNVLEQMKFSKENFLKFVQVYINNEPYLRLGGEYDKILLEKVLSEFDIKFETEEIEDGIIIPVRKGEKYELVGAGKSKPEGGNIILYDCRGDYSIFPDKNHLEEIQQYSPIKLIIENKSDLK